MRLLDEMLDHPLGDLEVGDHAVAQRADGLDVGGGLAHHQLGVGADRGDLGGAAAIVHRHHRRLVEHDPLTAHVNHRVGGAEVDRDIARAEAEQTSKAHGRYFLRIA